MKETEMKSYQSCAVCIWIAFVIFMAGLGLARQACDKGEIYEVTAYCPNSCCCGAWADGMTASGHIIEPGDHFVAGPSEIPFGTLVRVDGYNNGKPVPVLDRGGSITAGKLDVYFPTHAEALAWGRRKVKVTQ
jgi:3D (Asp-Asp-Asp) domain-containing protein